MATDAVPVRLTRAQSRARTRELLLAAAMRVFARDGYAGASVDAIAAQAGFTVGALYSNFGTKQELFLAVFEAHCAGELAALRELAERAGGDRDTLLAAVSGRFAELDQAQREWWQLGTELWLFAQRHEQAAQRLAAIQAEARTVIAEALGRPGQPLDEQVAGMVHALWGGWVRYRLTDPDAAAPEAFARGVSWLFDGQQADERTRERKGRQR
jgi:AcrR family transcriptional regulator